MTSEDEVSYFTLLKNPTYRRFFLAQSVSSLGDWVGVVAIAVFAERIGGGPAAVGSVLTARVLPGFIVGPVAGVLADRWDRKRTMIVSDLLRALIIFSLPFMPNLLLLLVASIALESLTLIWGPAKDASLPHMVPMNQLTHANSLNLLAIYGPWPLSTVLFAALAGLGGFLADRVEVLSGLRGNEEALALWVDSLTFGLSALIISTLAIPSSIRRAERLDLGEIKRDLVEGLSFVVTHKQVRPWMLGIGFTFTAAGAVFSLGVTFVREVLGGGKLGFAFLVGFLGTGMIVGLLAVGALVKRIQKDVLFSASIVLLGIGLIGLASMGSLDGAIVLGSTLGFFGGVAYSTGYSLMHEATEDELRGRTFSAAYTVIRIGTLVGLGVLPSIAGLIGSHRIGSYPVPGTRVTLWIAGLVALAGGIVSIRAIRARQAVAHAETPAPRRGFFVVFEGGEGAGKTTQMDALARWLEARGERVVTTKEPGGTRIGARIRELLLDPAASEMDPRTEALLYAADRSQHVAEVIRPALEHGRVVISDRFVDSSLAYQGIARGLGLDQIYEISEWATGGIMPDLVFFLQLDAKAGLRRVVDELDRIEGEQGDFHDRVAAAYVELAKRFPERFVVLDASRAQSQLHDDIVCCYKERIGGREDSLAAVRDLAAPGPPVPR